MASAQWRAESLDVLADGVRAGDRATLARAITLIESSKDEHAALAQELLQRLLPHTGRAHRIGITGVPGVGKSTAIDQLGMNLVGAGPQDRRAGHRPDLDALGRLDPGRQDAHGAAGPEPRPPSSAPRRPRARSAAWRARRARPCCCWRRPASTW